MRLFLHIAPVLAVFQLDFSVHRGTSYRDGVVGRDLVKRDPFDLSIGNERLFYIAKLEIGSLKQKVDVLVDTGSSDLWVPALNCTAEFGSTGKEVPKRGRVLKYLDGFYDLSEIHDQKAGLGAGSLDFVAKELVNGGKAGVDKARSTLSPTVTSIASTSSSIASADISACTSYGVFDLSKSSSFKVNSTLGKLGLEYGDGSFAKGIYVSDDITIGGQTVKGMNFALCDRTNSQSGVLGLGPPALESSYLLGDVNQVYSHQYDNLPMLLKLQGIIKRNVYSVSLGPEDALEGSVLFGAIDHSKYTGTLQRVKVLNRYANVGEKSPVYLEIALDSLRGNGLTIDSRASILLDTGATNNFMPLAYVKQIASHLKGRLGASGIYTVSCDYLNLDEIFTFSFSGVEISVPLKNLILRSTSRCHLGIFAEDTKPSLGDSFLRHAYIVYDLDNYEIALAQASNSSGEPDIEEVTSEIPNAQTAQQYDFTSISQQFGFTKVGTRSKFTMFTTTFDNMIPSAAPSSTEELASVESTAAITSSQVSTTQAYGNTTVANITSTTNLEAINAVSSTSAPRSSSTLLRGGSSHLYQGPAYILLAIFTAILLVF